MKANVVSYRPFQKLEGNIRVDDQYLLVDGQPYPLADIIAYSSVEGWAYLSLSKQVLKEVVAPMVLDEPSFRPSGQWVTAYRDGKDQEGIKIRRANLEIIE